MKHRYFASIFICPILLLTLFFSCGRTYSIETIIDDEAGTDLSAANLTMFWSRPEQRGEGAGSRDLRLYRTSNDSDGPAIEKSGLKSASAARSEFGNNEIRAEFTEEAAKIFAKMTKEASEDNQRPIGVVIDEEVWMNPRVMSPITGGKMSMSGDLELDEPMIVARQLTWKPLPVKLKVISQRILSKK